MKIPDSRNLYLEGLGKHNRCISQAHFLPVIPCRPHAASTGTLHTVRIKEATKVKLRRYPSSKPKTHLQGRGRQERGGRITLHICTPGLEPHMCTGTVHYGSTLAPCGFGHLNTLIFISSVVLAILLNTQKPHAARGYYTTRFRSIQQC